MVAQESTPECSAMTRSRVSKPPASRHSDSRRVKVSAASAGVARYLLFTWPSLPSCGTFSQNRSSSGASSTTIASMMVRLRPGAYSGPTSASGSRIILGMGSSSLPTCRSGEVVAVRIRCCWNASHPMDPSAFESM
eukprot:scaffold4961_cov114-Isochrysis_galbana.AAC.5